jgi:hypothetical protein
MRHPFREIIPPVDFFSDFAAYGTDKWASITSPTQMSIVDDPVTGAARKVLRMEVPDSYTSGPTINPRCQLSTANAIRAGSDFWLGFGLYLPSGDYHLDASRAWIAFVQLYGAPFTGYPPFRIAFEGPGPTGDRAGFGWKREPAMGDDWACLIAPQNDAWMDFACHVKMSADPAVGFVEIWTNFGSGWIPRTMLPVGGIVTTTPAGGHRLYTQTITPAVQLGRLRTDAQLYRMVSEVPSVLCFETDHRRIPATGSDLADINSVNPGSY